MDAYRPVHLISLIGFIDGLEILPNNSFHFFSMIIGVPKHSKPHFEKPMLGNKIKGALYMLILSLRELNNCLFIPFQIQADLLLHLNWIIDFLQALNVGDVLFWVHLRVSGC